MAAAANVYGNFYKSALTTPINWSSDAIKIALVTSSYTPALDTDVFWSAASANEVSSSGSYTASTTNGGITLGTKTVTVYNGAASGGTQWNVANPSGTITAGVWATAKVVAVGDIVIPITKNGYLFICVVAGTTHASTEPTWTAIQGTTIADNSCTWSCLGQTVTLFGSASPSATTATITARYGVIYDTTPGAGGSNPLIALYDFGSNQTSTAGTFTVTVPAYGWFTASPQ